MVTPKLESLSVFFPCYNEEKNIAATIAGAIPVIKTVARSWEILIINDGSRDDTSKVLEAIKQRYPHVHLVNHPQNQGYGAALKSGFYNSRYDWIVFTDGDGQFDFDDIHRLIDTQKRTDADLVIGFYLDRQVPLYRIWGSKVWQLAVFILFGLRVRDIDCGFKLIRKKVIDTIPRLQAQRGPFISSELLIKAKKSGFRIIEVGVHHRARLHGKATGTDLNVILSGFKDLFRLWSKLNFSHQ